MKMTSSNEVPSAGKAFTGFLGRRNSRLSEKGFVVIAFGAPHFFWGGGSPSRQTISVRSLVLVKDEFSFSGNVLTLTTIPDPNFTTARALRSLSGDQSFYNIP